MSLSLLVTGCTLAFGAAPLPRHAAFLFELAGVPVGTVTLSVQERDYVYRSRQLFTRGEDRTRVTRTERFRLEPDGRLTGAEAYPESLWLSKRPPRRGCVRVRSETTAKEGDACVDALSPEAAQGELFGQRFAARYQRGRLVELSLGPSRFRAIPPGEPELADTVDLFGAGFPISRAEAEGPLAVSPPLVEGPPPRLRRWREAEARALAASVHAAFAQKLPSAADLGEGGQGASGGCLAHAKRFARIARERGADAAVVHGVTALPGEANAAPHAWVRVRDEQGRLLDLDPTSLEPVLPRTHLPLVALGAGDAAADAGAVWLSLLSGARQVSRQPDGPRPRPSR